MKEIEVLIEVKSDKETALSALGQFNDQGIKRTLDIYYYDPLKKDLQPDDTGKLKACFRIREKDGKSSIAYKVDHFNGDEWSHSDEYETGIENPEIMTKIVEKLGLVELIRIDNEKHIFLTSDYEIVLEDVKGLGLFMEVENLKEVSDDKVSETKEEIRDFLNSLNIEFGEEQNAGKPELMLRKIK
jgi:adenylate cyclase class 2